MTLREMSPAEYRAWLESISAEIDKLRSDGGHSTFCPFPGGGYPGETDAEYRERISFAKGRAQEREVSR